MPFRIGAGYKSPAQRTRVITEAWGERNFYCLNCSSPRLERTRAGTKAHDFVCPRCEARYELKGQSRPLRQKIMDAAYSSMVEAIRTGRTPNLFATHYDPHTWVVHDLILIPRFVFTESAIEKRRPLSAGARRGGWVGCNIVLASIPERARIPLVVAGRIVPAAITRKRYRRLRPLSAMRLDVRGWTLDVLNVIQRLNQREFSLKDIYSGADELRRLHPNNRHVEDKIRQQLQRLRDLGFVAFRGRGRYRLI